ncbi:MAG: T9SS type A sorting domain-containing protein [Chryseobacterium sp.]|nr:T9SS type A sorting domain-containing protein [Chryseobacterium sp.]
MKKVLLGMCVVATQFVFAQQLISFETSEGYTAGNIDGQQGWTTTGTGAGQPNVANQLVSAEQAVAGTNSLKITKEAAFPGQQNPIVGGFKDIGSAIPHNNFVLSFDIRITEQLTTSSDFEFQTTGQGPTGGVYVIRLRFANDGDIYAVQTVGGTSSYAATTGTWVPNTWYRVKIEGTATGLNYYLNGTQIFSGQFYTTYAFTGLRFVHDNYAGSAYIDRIAINNEAALSTSEIVKRTESISIYPNPTSDILNIGTKEKVQSASIFDMTGRKIEARVMNNTVDVTSLERGTYIINIQTEKGTTSEKFIKK